MKKMLLLLFIMTGLLPNDAKAQDVRWSPNHVYYGQGGALSYTADALGNTIPDFSHVGYMYGDDSIPHIPTVVEVSPVDGDDGQAIQSAIDLAEAMRPDENGFRGAVLLKKGSYEVSGQLTIQASGVVLRGEGNTNEGSVIVAEGTSTRDLIVIDNGSGMTIDFGSKVDITEAYVPVGRKFLLVSNTSAYSAGDHIAIYRPGTREWISDIRMDQITPGEDIVQWDPASYSFYFERLLTRVSGDTLFFRNPVVMAMESQYGGGAVYKVGFDRLEKVGVEDLCLKSAYTSDTDESHSWKAIVFKSVENGWARRISAWHFAYACVSLEKSSRLISVLDCHCREPKSILTGGRRYSFNLAGSLNLFYGCTTSEGRHDYVSGARVCGPNVFSHCSASRAQNDIGPHHRWAMGTLFDLIESDGAINVQDRDASGTGHGWAGANQVFWNCKATSSVCQSPWYSALNYNFGFMGTKSQGSYPDRPDGVWTGHNFAGIFPISLYDAQLESRMEDLRYFSVYPDLQATNDTCFILSFNLPFDTSSIMEENFSVSGTAGYAERDFSLDILNDSSVSLSFKDIGPLPAFGTVIVSAGNINSVDGQSLRGGTLAIYEEDDLRPRVSGVGLTVNNEDEFLLASSSKPGLVYIVKYPAAYLTVADLDRAVENNLGRKVAAPEANVSVAIYTRGLPGGYYNYYAVDEEGRMSEPDTKWPIVKETGPINGLQQAGGETGFKVWYANGLIFVQVEEHSRSYSIQLYDLRGSLLDQRSNLNGDQCFPPPAKKGMLLLRKISTLDLETKKIMIW